MLNLNRANEGDTMGMEHRWGVRQKIELDAVIEHGYGHLKHRIRACIRDISSSGVFVVGPADGLPLNALVELKSTLHHGGVTQVHRMKAMVTRIAPDGVGLMFGEIGQREISQLLLSLRGHDARAAARKLSPPLPGADDALVPAEWSAVRNASG